jgi:hypothetical protein
VTDPTVATFVRSTKPGSDEWFRTAQDRLRVDNGDAQAFARWRVAIAEGRGHSSSTLTAKSEEPFVGDLPARSVVAGPVTRNLTWNTRPAVIAGSADRPVAISGGNNRLLTWDVTADVTALLAAEETLLAFRFDASSTTAQWLETASLDLTIDTYALAVAPSNVNPTGPVGTLKPTFSWTAPKGISQVQMQIDEAGGDWTTPVYDSGALPGTTGAIDTATQGPAWAGLSGTMQARVRHFTTAAGWSPYTTVTVSYLATTNYVVTNPGATDADPTPPSVWTPAADAVRIISYLDGEKIHDTDMLPGPITSHTPAKGANKSGQVLQRVYEFYDGTERTMPAFVKRTTETTFTKTATVAGLTTFTVAQDGRTPAVIPTFTRAAGVPDEISLAPGVGDDPLAMLPGTGSGTAKAWTLQPNTDLTLVGTAVVNGNHSSAGISRAIRVAVEGVWIVDPLTDRGCVLTDTEDLDIAYGGEVVVHTPIDGAILLRRTLTLRGPEGSFSGRIGEWPGRTLLQQKEDIDWLRQRPERELRLILGDLNINIACSSLQAIFDKGPASTTTQIRHRVTGAFSWAGGI